MRHFPLLALVAVVGLAACRTLPPPPPPRAAGPAEVLAALRARQEGIKGFQAKGRLTLIAPGRNYSGSGRLKAGFPTLLRVDLVDLFGRSLMSFSSDGARVEMLFPRDGKLLTGPATPGSLAGLIPPGLTLPQCLRLLAGAVPFSQEEPTSWQESGENRGLVMTWLNSEGSLREKLWTEAGGHPVRQEWGGPDGRSRIQAEFADFSGPGGWPKQVKVKTAEPQTELRVAFGDLTINPPLTPADFAISRPPGVIEMPLKP
jgi:outer membrane lipoprotein-sorting protein